MNSSLFVILVSIVKSTLLRVPILNDFINATIRLDDREPFLYPIRISSANECEMFFNSTDILLASIEIADLVIGDCRLYSSSEHRDSFIGIGPLSFFVREFGSTAVVNNELIIGDENVFLSSCCPNSTVAIPLRGPYVRGTIRMGTTGHYLESNVIRLSSKSMLTLPPSFLWYMWDILRSRGAIVEDSGIVTDCNRTTIEGYLPVIEFDTGVYGIIKWYPLDYVSLIAGNVCVINIAIDDRPGFDPLRIRNASVRFTSEKIEICED